MVGFIRRAIDFVIRPTHSRTIGILIFFIFVTAISLTVYVAQQQQTIRQRAAEPEANCTVTADWSSISFQNKPYTIFYVSGPTDLTKPTILKTENTSYTFTEVLPGSYYFRINDNPPSLAEVVKVEATCPSGQTSSDIFDCSGTKNAMEYSCYSNSALPKNVCPQGSTKDCWFPIEPTTKTDCESKNQVCYARIPTASSPSTSTQTPSICNNYTNANSCIADKNCAWGKLPTTNLSCYPFNNNFKCPTGFEEWYWQDSKTNECAVIPTPTFTPTPTPTLTPNLFTCANQTGPAAGNYQCSDIINRATQCPDGYEVYTPSVPYTGISCGANQGCCKQKVITSPNLFVCQNQTTGEYKGNYTCADILNESTQCPDGYTSFDTPNKYLGTSCGITRGCCKENATLAPASTTPLNNVTLVMSLNVQDALLSEENLPVNLILYDLATYSQVSGAPANQKLKKTSIPDRQYAATIPLTNLASGKYFVIVRKDNMIAKSVFNVSSSNGNIEVPTTTLVFGDLNNDNDINILDHDNVFKSCWKKPVTGSCASSNFDKNAIIDDVDYNIWLKGHATWRTEE